MIDLITVEMVLSWDPCEDYDGTAAGAAAGAAGAAGAAAWDAQIGHLAVMIEAEYE